MSEERDRGATERDAEELYENAPCAYLSTRPDGTIVRANRTFFEWSGRSSDTTVGQVRFQSLLTIGGRMYYETHYAPLLEMQGVVNEIALEMRRADGTARPVVASARQVRDAGGVVILHRIALFDSSDRRRYERELLTERKRAEAAALALADVDRRKTEFMTVLAHELRNPLAPIRTALEIISLSRHADPTIDTAASIMQRQVAQLSRLVEDLLDVGRVGQDKLSLQLAPVDLASVLRDAVEVSEPLLLAAGLTLALEVPASSIRAAADSARLSQAIGNVLNNAAKFTPRGGKVWLILERDADSALIRIRDTGIGMDAADASRVFELFMQANPAPERRAGLGIGLPLAKSLIERHGGAITIHSEGRGLGTEVTIRLPIDTA